MKNTFTKIGMLALATLMSAGSKAQSVSGGINFTISVCSDNSVMSWGYNGQGQLGDSTMTDRTAPVDVYGISDVIAVASGTAHTLALKSDGTVMSWGYNVYSALGSGTPGGAEEAPVPVAGLTNIIAIAAGGYHSLALKNDGTVWTWGSNFGGELGDGTTVGARATAVQVTSISGIIAIAAGATHSLAVKNDGTLYGWGFNVDGRVGDGTTTNRFSPVVITTLTGVTAIAAGGNHSLARKNDGTIWAWGKNDNGQLGDGTSSNKSVPTLVSGLSDVVSLKAGEYFSMALKSDGTVWTWGDNSKGQLGDGTYSDRPAPVQATGVSGVNSINCGTEHSLALKSDGTLLTWGANGSYQLGIANNLDQTSASTAAGLCAGLVSGIDSRENEIAINVYPNPSGGKLNVETSVTNGSLSVLNAFGQEVKWEAISGVQQIDLTNLADGLYFVRIVSDQGSAVRRIMISK